MRPRIWLLVLLSGVLIGQRNAAGQAPTGQITGRLLDPAGSAIPDGKLTAVNNDTGVRTETASNEGGNYLILNLIPGMYRLEVDASGFKHYVRQGIELRVGDVLGIDIAMEVGGVKETVTVAATAPLLESETASLGKVVDNRRIIDLPTPTGSVYYLMQLMPGVANTASPTNLYGPNEMGPPAGVTVAGTQANSTEFAIDGNPIMSNAGVTFNPPQEMVQEFRVQTAAYDASLGRFAGAQVNLVMKSGTNSFHGSAVFTNLSRGMVSHDFFTNRFIWDPTTGPITSAKIDRAWPPQRTVQYRGVVSGPVFLPKIYDGRNRTFWMFGFQDYIRDGCTPSLYTVPTAAERTGNFSALLALGSVYQIYDPATVTSIGNGRYTRQPMPGNIIPASRMASMSQKLMQYYPLPNTLGTADGVNNYEDPDANGNRYKSYMGRLDHTITDRNRLQGSVTILEQHDYSLEVFHNAAAGNLLYRTQRGAALNDTWTLRPNLLLEVRYGLTRYGQHNYPPSLGFDLSQLGFVSSLVDQLDRTYTSIPQTAISGYTTIGNTSGTDVITTYHNLNAQASYIRGNHSFKFGTDLRLLQEASYTWGNISPGFTFDPTYTRGPVDNSAAAPIGQGLAAFEMGVLTSGGIDRNASIFQSSKYVGLYFQDDWKVTRRLTVNLGLRYDLDIPLTERYNRSLSGFDFNATLPFAAAAVAAYALHPIPEVPVSGFHVAGQIIYPGLNGASRGLWNTDGNNLAPRVGIAWQVRPKTVIRAGYGIFYQPAGADVSTAIQSGFSRRTTLTPTVDNGATFIADMQNPFPNGILQPAGASSGYQLGLGSSLSFFNPNLHSGYNQRWSFGMQRQFARRLMFDLSYIGNRAVGLPLAQQYDPIPAQYLSTLPYRDQTQINYLSQSVTNPFYNLPGWQGAGLQTTTVQRAQLLRPIPQLTSLTSTDNGGYSWYHALLFRVEKRMARGFTMDGSYTWSKFMEAITKLNVTDPRQSRVISTLDRPQILAISGIYELPFGHGKPWLNHGRLLDLGLGGWQLQAIYQAQSGQPIDFPDLLFFYGNPANIALPSSKRTVEEWFNVNAGFNRNATQQPSDDIRTWPLRFPGIRSSGVNNLNASVIKNFHIREGVQLQFRAEAVDVTNAAVFATPNTSPTSTAFGQVTALRNSGTQRRITFIGKLTW